MFMQMVFSEVHHACHNIANGIKPGSNSKKTDKHAADCSKVVCWGVKFIHYFERVSQLAHKLFYLAALYKYLYTYIQ